MSSIEWTGETWNPVVGCSRVSAGCEHCYAERVAHRGMSESHRGLTVVGKHGPRWTGEVRFLPERLEQPLRWRKPRRVFVNSMSDLFHEGLCFEQIAAVFGVMAATRHTHQVLTKRLGRALEFFAWLGSDPAEAVRVAARKALTDADVRNVREKVGWHAGRWPLPNVHLLASVEDQATADERIPLLLECPAAVRGVSYEPALGPVDFSRWLSLGRPCSAERPCSVCSGGGEACDRLDWVIVGGESGPGARPFDLAWARSTVAQCKAAGVPCFVKQLGAAPVVTHVAVRDDRGRKVPGEFFRCRPEEGKRGRLRHRKGADMAEWPADLRVREFPA